MSRMGLLGGALGGIFFLALVGGAYAPTLAMLPEGDGNVTSAAGATTYVIGVSGVT